jgi:CelD/BcsL family acetyltransferase involved in cellulose biosynthesis
MGPVGLPGSEEAVAKELIAALAEASWGRADLGGLALDSPWADALASAAASRGLSVAWSDHGAAPIIALPASFDDYLQGLPAKLRHEIRRKRRRLVQDLGPFTVRESTPATVAADYDRFMELHRHSPGPKGRFMHPGMEIFFRRLGEAFLARHVFHLAFLEAAEERAAAAIGFGYKDTFSLYNSAFDHSFAHLSPGMVLVAELIRHAIDSGRTTFDLLKGDLDYKFRFGASPRPIGRLLLTR